MQGNSQPELERFIGQFTDLRRRLRATGSEAHVVKNAILRLAAREVGLPDLAGSLTGQLAVVTGQKDISAAAKVLKNFAAEFEKPKLRFGFLDNQRLEAAQLVALVAGRRGDMAWLARERGNIIAGIEALLTEGRSAEAGALARVIEPLLALRGLWSSWGQVIGWAEQAARAVGDRALLAWVLHERGTRAGLSGDREAARADLDQARRLRLELGDARGAAASLRNMSYLRLLPPAAPLSPRQGRGPLRLLDRLHRRPDRL